jgi:hypothetical protein
VSDQTYFISYTSHAENDVKWAVWIEHVLRKTVGAKTIMQEYDFRPGDNFKALMDEALKKADIVICVYDNAEGCLGLRDYLPHGHSRGHILINLCQWLQGIIGEKLVALVFTPEDAVEFLENRIKDTKKSDATKLSSALGCLPLALEQATVYVNENQITIAYYLELFRTSGLQVLDTLPDTGYDKTVLTSFKITFDKIEQDKQSEPSVQLFKLLAYCAPDDIPFRMFIDGRDKMPQPLRDRLDPNDEVGHISLIRELARYSLVSMRRDKDGDIFLSVHRLTQEAAIHDLDDKAKYLLSCLDIVLEVFDCEYGTREDFESFALNMPHALEITRREESSPMGDDEAKVKAARIYSETGTGLGERGEYVTALEWNKKALAIRERVFGAEHPFTLAISNSVANIYKNQDKYIKSK